MIFLGLAWLGVLALVLLWLGYGVAMHRYLKRTALPEAANAEFRVNGQPAHMTAWYDMERQVMVECDCTACRERRKNMGDWTSFPRDEEGDVNDTPWKMPAGHMKGRETVAYHIDAANDAEAVTKFLSRYGK